MTTSDRFIFHPERLDAVPDDHWAAPDLERILDDPDFAFRWEDEGADADILMQVLTDPYSGLLESPQGVSLWFDWSMGPDHSPYYAFYLSIRRTDHSPYLRIYGQSEDYPDFAPHTVAKGREAVLALYNEAVATANGLLDDLAAYCHEEVRP